MPRSTNAKSHTPLHAPLHTSSRAPLHAPLYTPEQRLRRDRSHWTLVQGILAPIQFLVFIVSLVLVVRVLLTGEGEGAAAVSILIKTLTLYTIMVTGALWERDVFGQYLFAPAFWWEDAVSMIVIALHTLYVVMYLFDIGAVQTQMIVALAAYATYVVNAAQFLWKLRMARLGGESTRHTAHAPSAGQTVPATRLAESSS